MFSCLLDLIFQLLALSDVDFYQLHVCACVRVCVCVCVCFSEIRGTGEPITSYTGLCMD